MKLHCWGLVITKIPQAIYIIQVLLRKNMDREKYQSPDIYKMLYEINTLFIGEEKSSPSSMNRKKFARWKVFRSTHPISS